MIAFALGVEKLFRFPPRGAGCDENGGVCFVLSRVRCRQDETGFGPGSSPWVGCSRAGCPGRGSPGSRLGWALLSCVVVTGWNTRLV